MTLSLKESLSLEYSNLWETKKKAKRNYYEISLRIGWITTFFNLITVFVGLVLVQSESGVTFLAIISLISSFGILLMTSVPIDEISFDEMLMLESNHGMKQATIALLTIYFLFMGIMFLTIFPLYLMFPWFMLIISLSFLSKLTCFNTYDESTILGFLFVDKIPSNPYKALFYSIAGKLAMVLFCFMGTLAFGFSPTFYIYNDDDDYYYYTDDNNSTSTTNGDDNFDDYNDDYYASNSSFNVEFFLFLNLVLVIVLVPYIFIMALKNLIDLYTKNSADESIFKYFRCNNVLLEDAEELKKDIYLITNKLFYDILLTYTIITGSLIIQYFGNGTGIAIGFVYCSSVLYVLYVGREKWLLSAARYFELKIDDALNDAAYMSSLATLSVAFDEQYINGFGKIGIYWLYRSNESTVHRNINDPNAYHYIKREFFVRGNLKYDSEDNLILRNENNKSIAQLSINYYEDNDLNWYAYFEGNTTKFNQPLQSIMKNKHYKAPEQEFLQWVNHNFSSYEEKEMKNPWVIIKVSLDNQKEKDELQNFASQNLRKFKLTECFDSDLLMKSPRELKDDKEKEFIYSLSIPVDTNLIINNTLENPFFNFKIDYFISHSWADSPSELEGKVKCLQTFAKENNRFSFSNYFKHMSLNQEPDYYPTVWLDKVCINQKEQGLGIAVLPLNVTFCNKILAVLTETYLTRIWCIWELFVLFIFCKKEVAMERLKIISIDKGETVQNRNTFDSLVSYYFPKTMKKANDLKILLTKLKDIDLNKAHAFDPNEEFKIKQIMFSIGEERIKEIKFSIETIVQKEIDHVLRFLNVFEYPLKLIYYSFLYIQSLFGRNNRVIDGDEVIY